MKLTKKIFYFLFYFISYFSSVFFRNKHNIRKLTKELEITKDISIEVSLWVGFCWKERNRKSNP